MFTNNLINEKKVKIGRPKSKQPMPEHAKKVFSGVVFDIYQWEQEMFDGSVEIFERTKRPDTVNVIPITIDGKIIVLEEEQPGSGKMLGLAGGRVDEGEDVLEAAKRELLEETGYVSDDFFLWSSMQPLEKTEWAVYTFLARSAKQEKEMNPESGEKIKLKFIDFEEYINFTLSEEHREKELIERLMVIDKIRTENNPENLEKLRKIFYPE